MTTQEPYPSDFCRTQIVYTEGESMNKIIATGESTSESIVGAIGGALVASSASVFEQAETSEKYQEILKQIEACSIFQKRRKKELMARADDLRTDLVRQAILTSLANFEPLNFTQQSIAE